MEYHVQDVGVAGQSQGRQLPAIPGKRKESGAVQQESQIIYPTLCRIYHNRNIKVETLVFEEKSRHFTRRVKTNMFWQNYLESARQNRSFFVMIRDVRDSRMLVRAPKHMMKEI